MMRRFQLLVAGIALLAGCSSLPFARQRLDNRSGRAVPADATLTVITYNMLHGFGDRLNDRTLEARLDLLAHALVVSGADVIILQEASLTPSRKHGSVAERLRDLLNAAMPDRERYGSAIAMAHGSRLIGFYEGSAVLSRFAIESAETIGYRAQALVPPERRIALRVVLRGERGPIEIIGTHLTNLQARRGSVQVRELQARELVDRVLESGDRGRSVVIGGDFNSAPESSVVRGILTAGAVDAWASSRPGENGFTALEGGVTDPSARAVARIDYLFVRGFRVLSTEAFLDRPVTGPDGRCLWVSDHVGVLARIALP